MKRPWHPRKKGASYRRADKLRLMSSACTPTTATMKTGLLLRQAREQAGLSQRELAGRLGCTQPAVSQAEAGGAHPGGGTPPRVPAALGREVQPADVSPEGAPTQGVPAKVPPP